MPFPILPSDWRSIVPSSTGKLCVKLVKSLIGGMSKLLTIITWGVNEDGSPSDALKAWLNFATSGSIPSPTNLTASGAADHITLNWNSVNVAQSYDVFRSTTQSPPTTPTYSGISTNTFVDSASVGSFDVGTLYYYWVRATNSSGSSLLGNSASASAGSILSPQVFGVGTGNQSFTVPNVASIDIKLWAPGGGGGGSWRNATTGSYSPTGTYPYTYAGAGGGGSGEYILVTVPVGGANPVQPGDILTVFVPDGGVGGPPANPQGSAGATGNATFVARSNGSDLARAYGGQGGFGGVAGGGQGGNGGTGGGGTAGTAGDNGTQTGGGAGGPANNGYGAGGTGAGTITIDSPFTSVGGVTGSKGSGGRVEISW